MREKKTKCMNKFVIIAELIPIYYYYSSFVIYRTGFYNCNSNSCFATSYDNKFINLHSNVFILATNIIKFCKLCHYIPNLNVETINIIDNYK